MNKKLLVIFIILFFFLIQWQTAIAYESSKNRCGDHTILYYSDALLEYEKSIAPPFFKLRKHVNVNSIAPVIHFDANAQENLLEIILNYTSVMNFTAGFPFIILAPLVAFGLKVDNYTDYVWKSFKLKHDGYFKCVGNISVEICFDMENIESGDEIVIHPSVVVIGDPKIFTTNEFPRESKFTSILLRFAFNLPSRNNLFLHKVILPFFSVNNKFDTVPIHVIFS